MFQNNSAYQIENYALKLSLEFGKDFGKDISQRLLSKFPNLSQNDLEHYKVLTKNIEIDCWNCVDYKGPQINSNQLNNLLKENVFSKYSWIDNSNKTNIITKFQYYFWKDGILK